jgi:glycosyltransferase involved in cell wall biosynthesis
LPARIVRDKGILEFVAAARSLRSELGSQARFVLVGGIDDASANTISEAQVLTWQKEGVIEWWGHRSDMPSTLGQAHIVCLPSYREGFPKSLIEAAACARAVVTTDVPGCRDAIEHGTTGLLAKVQDAPDLARQLARLLADPTLVESMGREGRRMAERRFSQQRVIQRHLSVYRATGDACPLLEPAE